MPAPPATAPDQRGDSWMLPFTDTLTVVLPGSTGWACSAMPAVAATAMRYIGAGIGLPDSAAAHRHLTQAVAGKAELARMRFGTVLEAADGLRRHLGLDLVARLA